jgi:subtilisin family serine protease
VVSWNGTSFATPIVSGLIAARASRPGKDVHTAWAELKEVANQSVMAGLPVLRPGDA